MGAGGEEDKAQPEWNQMGNTVQNIPGFLESQVQGPLHLQGSKELHNHHSAFPGRGGGEEITSLVRQSFASPCAGEGNSQPSSVAVLTTANSKEPNQSEAGAWQPLPIATTQAKEHSFALFQWGFLILLSTTDCCSLQSEPMLCFLQGPPAVR